MLVVAQQKDEGLSEDKGLLWSQDSLYLVHFDVVFEVDLEILKPFVEVKGGEGTLLRIEEADDGAVVEMKFKDTFEEDPE